MLNINVALVGMGFGCRFIPIYLKHPAVGNLTISDTDPGRLKQARDQFGVARGVASLEEILADPGIDAVHLVTGIPDHARQVIAVLRAGKHCACTVPMATSLEDIRAIIAAVRESGKNYMMMETQIYSREYLYACELRERGTFGPLQFLRGAHYQDMENWPWYWAGLPPMWYSTHAVAPLLGFAGTRAKSVQCLGSGALRPELRELYGNPYPVETAIFQLEREIPLAMEITRSLFQTSRAYLESFNIYGEDASLEWPYHGEPLVLTRQSRLGEHDGPRRAIPERIGLPDYASRLPAEIAEFTGGVTDDGQAAHPSVRHGGSHGGSHPHLVHEFIRSIVEKRKPAIDEIRAADWTAAGICAHQSAMLDGARVEIPRF